MPAAAIKASRETRVSGRMIIHPYFHILGERCQNKARKNHQISDVRLERHIELYCSAHKRPNALFKTVSSPFCPTGLGCV
jgi:hypothetical protein